MLTNRLIKILFSLLLCIISVNGLATHAESTQPSEPADMLDKIAVIVNSDIITQSQVDQAIDRIKDEIRASHSAMPDDTVLKAGVINQLIARQLQLQIAKKAGIKVTDNQIDAAIQRIAAEHHITVYELEQKVQSQGYTRATFRAEISKQITLAQVEQQATINSVSVTKSDIANYLKEYAQAQQPTTQYHVGDILIPLTNSSSAQQLKAAETKAAAIIHQLKRGKKINDVASEYKDAQYSDLGWRLSVNLPDLFAQKVIHMKANEIAGPIKAPNGYHILILIGTHGQPVPKPTATQLQQLVYQQKLQKAVEKWVATLRKNAYIKILD